MRKLIAALSDFIQSSFHSIDFTLYATLFLAVASCWYSCAGRMHTSDMLHEEILAVEVVRSIGRFGALVAAPEAHAEMLGHGVAFPFVFGVESRFAAVRRERAEEGAGGFFGFV